jgi:hypothetical protein
MSANLDDYKSELVQSVDCEIEMLQQGDLKCANKMLKYRYEAMLRVFIIECLLDQDDYDQSLVNYLYEVVKELTRLIVINKCIQSKC